MITTSMQLEKIGGFSVVGFKKKFVVRDRLEAVVVTNWPPKCGVYSTLTL